MISSTKKPIMIILLTYLSFKFVKTDEVSIRLEYFGYMDGEFKNNCIKEIAQYFRIPIQESNHVYDGDTVYVLEGNITRKKCAENAIMLLTIDGQEYSRYGRDYYYSFLSAFIPESIQNPSEFCARNITEKLKMALTFCADKIANCTDKILEKFVENDSEVALKHAFYKWVLNDFEGQRNYRADYMIHIAISLQLNDRLQEPDDYCKEESKKRRRALNNPVPNFYLEDEYMEYLEEEPEGNYTAFVKKTIFNENIDR